MGEIQWNNSFCSLTYTGRVKNDIESNELLNKYKKVARVIVQEETYYLFLYEGHSISSANSHAFFH